MAGNSLLKGLLITVPDDNSFIWVFLVFLLDDLYVAANEMKEKLEAISPVYRGKNNL